LKSSHLDLDALDVDLHIEQTLECATPGDLLNARRRTATGTLDTSSSLTDRSFSGMLQCVKRRVLAALLPIW
jgi:hypothetical protein